MSANAKKTWEAWGQATSLYTLWASERNINPYRLFVLYAIDGNSSVTQKRVSEVTGLSKQTVNTVVRALKKEGYIELSTAENDRREKFVALTSVGRTYASKLLTPLYELEERVFDVIGAERIKEMLNTIRLFTTVFEKETEELKNE